MRQLYWLSFRVLKEGEARVLMLEESLLQVLERMVLDGSILLVDKISVRWNDIFREAHSEWPAFYSQIFDMLGVDNDKPSDPAALA